MTGAFKADMVVSMKHVGRRCLVPPRHRNRMRTRSCSVYAVPAVMVDKTSVVVFEAEAGQDGPLRSALPGVDCRFVEQTLSAQTVDQAADASVVSVFIRSQVSRTALESMANVRLIATRSTGYDHIDLAACRERGITVSNAPSTARTPSPSTPSASSSLSPGAWALDPADTQGDFSLRDLMGSDLRSKTLGVVGAGNIGLHVIRIGRAFGMEVLAYDAHPHPLLAEVLGFRYVSLDELLAGSDVITLHVPTGPRRTTSSTVTVWPR